MAWYSDIISLLTITLRGVSNKHCLLLFFIFAGNKDNYKSLDEFEFWQNSAPTSELVALEGLKKSHIILLALYRLHF